jgi:hypothetical protein
MNSDARDAILVGLFFIAYGVLTAVASGVKVPWRPRIMVDTIDSNRLQFALRRRDEMITQEHNEVPTDA